MIFSIKLYLKTCTKIVLDVFSILSLEPKKQTISTFSQVFFVVVHEMFPSETKSYDIQENCINLYKKLCLTFHYYLLRTKATDYFKIFTGFIFR